MTFTAPADWEGTARQDLGEGAEAPLWRTLQIARSAAGRVAVATILGAGAIGAAIGLLATAAWLIARASQHPSVVVLGLAIVAVRLFAISRGFLRYFERLVGHDAAFRTLADLRVGVYEQLEVIAPEGLPAFRRGDLLARLVEDVDSLQDLLLRVIPPFGIAVVVGALTVALISWALPAAGLVLLICLAAAATVVPLLSQGLARRSEARQAAARGELASGVVDLIEGAPDLVAYGATRAQLARIATADRELTAIQASAARTTGVGSGLTMLLTGLAVWGAVVVGVPALRSGRIDGPLLAVVVLTPLAAFELVAGLPAAAQSLERVRKSAARVFSVMDAADPVPDPGLPSPLPEGRGAVEIRGLRARHAPAAPWALDGLDLDLLPGRRVAVIGPSGAGKSTLAEVLLRFLSYEGGTVDLDGVDLDRLRGEDVRKVIGLAAQDAHVFDTTIRENLLIARRDASDGDLRDALGRARLLEWVDSLPQGMDAQVGEHGAKLSGGQRQRLAVARALLADFPVLVLDEPAEHLDAPTADALSADILRATEQRCVLLITHRLRGLENLDEIVVLDSGVAVERGTHAELLAKRGRYEHLWRREHESELAATVLENPGEARATA
jgi:thiol reductant ABC exporter CydC subunit